MANPEDVALALKGKEQWNAWALGDGRYHRNVNFSGTHFEVEDFKGFIFPRRANFSGCTFRQQADFHGAHFKRAVNFHQAQFLGNTNFSSCVFGGDASFTKALFQGEAIFIDAQFSGQAWFEGVEFGDNFDAAEAVFGSDARFSGTKFSKRAWFHDARFIRNAWFNNSVFLHDARFTRANFEGSGEEFSDAKFAMALDFRAARFHVPPTLQRSSVGYTTDPEARGICRIARRAFDNSQAPAYRRLKQFASEAKDHERELQFFALEMRAKRFYEITDFWPLVLNISYDWLSDYGRSIARPLAWWAGLVAASFVAVLLFVPGCAATGISRLGAALVIATTNSALLIGGDKWLPRLEAIERLCPACQGRLGLGVDLFFYLQSGLSLLFVFLVGLAFRNRFRIGGSN